MMKKIIKILLLLLIIPIILTGCGKKKEVVVDDTPVVADNISKEKLVINYIERTYNNGLVYLLKNKDEEIDAKNITVEAEFWKKGEDGADDILVTTTKKTYDCIEAGSTLAGYTSISTAKDFDYYKVFVDVGDASKIKKKAFVKSDVLFEDATNLNPTEEELANGIKADKSIKVVLKNKSEEKISNIDVAVVFYKDNIIVGYGKKSKQNLAGRTKSTISVLLPKAEFDSYRIFINEAYRRTIMS